MPLQSEIVQRLSADNSQFRSVMNQSERIADQTGRNILKRLDIRAGVVAIAAAIGFNFNNIAENIARVIISSTKQAEEALASVLKLGEETARIYDEIFRKRRTADQNIESDIAKQNRLLNEQQGILNGVAAKQAEIDEKNAAISKRIAQDKIVGSIFGLDESSLIPSAQPTDQQQVRLAEIAKELAELQKTIDEAQMERDKKAAAQTEENLKEEKRARMEIADEDVEWYKRRFSLEQRLRDQKLETLSPEERIAFLAKEVAGWKAKQAKTEKDSNEFLALQVKINDNNLEIEKERKEIAEDAAKAEKEITEEKTKQYEINSKGRGDTELSDRELERKISNINAELEAARAASQGTFLGPLAFSTQSTALSDYQRSQAARAQQELDFRRQVRQVAATSGEEAAFRQFSGLSEQRLREILQSAPGTQDVVAELKKLNGHLNRGIKTAVTTSEDT